ncbi:unnamed protein product [Calypogeia fissa]
MSLPVLFIGVVSILAVWAITNLGFPPDVFTFGVVPVLSIYCLCNHRKLREAAGQFRVSKVRFLAAAIAVLFSLLHARFRCIRFILWKLGVLLVWLLCLSKAFDYEKTMFMADTCGAWAKVVLWTVVTTFTGQAAWMSYNGEYSFCCPYTRKLVVIRTRRYYNLQKMHEELVAIPGRYRFSFPIGFCTLQCEYTELPPSPWNGVLDAHYGDHLSSEIGAAVCTPMESPRRALMWSVSHEDRRSPGCTHELELRPSSKVLECGPIVMDRSPLKSDRYEPVSNRFNKVEAVLKYKNDKVLESYTFYNIPLDAVAEFKRVLEVLKQEGNIIFSNLNREIGSSTPRAHARCYEFGELLDLILAQSYKLHEVDLEEDYVCAISGCWILQLQMVLTVAVNMGINYYQLTGPPKDLSTVILLLFLYAFVELFFSLVNTVCNPPWDILRRIVYNFINRFAPSKMKVCYQHFQARIPQLTFCNESYGHPHILRTPRYVCFLAPVSGILPRFGFYATSTPESIVHVGRLREGFMEFDLINLQLKLTVMFHRGNGVQRLTTVQVVVEYFRVYDQRLYLRDIFVHIEKKRAENLIALMSWLEDNECPGVCKSWPQDYLINAYRYDELINKTSEDDRKIEREVNRPKYSNFILSIICSNFELARL